MNYSNRCYSCFNYLKLDQIKYCKTCKKNNPDYRIIYFCPDISKLKSLLTSYYIKNLDLKQITTSIKEINASQYNKIISISSKKLIQRYQKSISLDLALKLKKVLKLPTRHLFKEDFIINKNNITQSILISEVFHKEDIATSSKNLYISCHYIYK